MADLMPDLSSETRRAIEAVLCECAERNHFGRVLKVHADAIAVDRHVNARAFWEEAVRRRLIDHCGSGPQLGGCGRAD